MINQTIPEWFREGKKKLAPMTWKQRAAYLWGYYRFHALAVIAALVILGFAIYGQVYAHQDVLISGMFLNTDTSEAGYQHLKEDYWAFCGSSPNKRVDMVETIMVRYSQDNPTSKDGETITMIDAMIGTQSVDYMVIDSSALEYFGPGELCMDLTEVLSEELLQKLDGKLVECYGLDMERNYCAAIDLSGSSFAEAYGLTMEPSYLIVLINTPQPEKVAVFLNYLFS